MPFLPEPLTSSHPANVDRPNVIPADIVDGTTPLTQVAALFCQEDEKSHTAKHCVLVVENNRLLGIITPKQILEAVARQETNGSIAAIVNHAEVFIVETELTVSRAIELLNQHDLHQLPVVDEQYYPIGIIVRSQLQFLHKNCCLSKRELIRDRELHQAIFNESTDAIFLVDAPTQLILDCNHRAVTLFEADCKDQLLGIRGDCVQKRQFTSEEIDSIADDMILRGFWSHELECMTLKGRSFWASLAVKQIRVNGHTINLMRFTDISERKQSELAMKQQDERDRLVASITKRIRQSLDLEFILNSAVSEIHSLLNTDRALVLRLHETISSKVVAESVNSNYRTTLHRLFSCETFPAHCFGRYLNGFVQILCDTNTSEIVPCMRQFYEKLSIRAKLIVPIAHQERLWGLLIVHQCSGPREWQTWEIDLLQQIANQLAIATQQLDLYERLQLELGKRERTQVQLQGINHQLAAANAELARATRLKDEFLANMSHELRTPLNAILGMAEGLQEEVFGSLSDRQRKAISTIDRSGKHLLELINDILDLSKIEAGMLEIQTSIVSVKTLCHSSLTFVRPIARKKNIPLQLEIANDIGSIKIDERRMRQVLINLLSNAVKFTPEGGRVTLRVRRVSPHANHQTLDQTHRQPEATLIRFEVEDTGIGIARENLDRLFHAFVQIDSRLSRQYEGTGLGLALVRRIVEMHGGTISVDSEVGRGSCFIVTLPQQSESEIQFRLPPELCRSKRVILLEDVLGSVDKLAYILSENHISTAIYPLYDLTLNSLLELKPDMIMIDVASVTSSAWQLIETLKSSISETSISLLLICDISVRDRAVEHNLPYLIKPVELPQLQQALRSCWRIDAADNPSQRSTSPDAASSSPQRLLLAEDNQANIDSMSDYLMSRGYHVIVARNGLEAIQKAASERPDLILMDIQMPGMDGLTAIQTLRSNPALATVPIIALTALAMSGDRERCLDVGATDYLMKPVKLKQLVGTIQNLLSKTN